MMVIKIIRVNNIIVINNINLIIIAIVYDVKCIVIIDK